VIGAGATVHIDLEMGTLNASDAAKMKKTIGALVG
jgi:hypothetical protein